jgi:hypothetical protein
MATHDRKNAGVCDFVEGPFTRSLRIIDRRGRVVSAAAAEFIKVLGSAR